MNQQNKLWKSKKNKFIIKFTLLISLVLSSGCIPLIAGAGAGVVTGVVLSNDSAIGNIQEEYRAVWDTCVDELKDMDAEILETNESKGTIKAVVSDNKIIIKIDTITSRSQRLKVSARKLLLPKPQFAQKVFLKIVDSLK